MADEDLMEEDGVAKLPEDDELSSTLRQEFDKLEGDDLKEEDDGGFDAPLEEGDIKSRDAVSEEDGIKRVQEAKDKASAPEKAKPKAEEEAKPAAKSPEGEKKKTPDPAAKEAEVEDKSKTPAEPASDDDFNAAISGLPEGVKTRIEAERAEYAEIMAPFKGQEERLAAIGQTPKTAVDFFVRTNDYAQRDPAGYMAWFVSQGVGGGDAAKAETILKDAATKLGYKIEKDAGPSASEEEDDPFMSDSERAARKELAETKARLAAVEQGGQPEFGPDSAAERSRRTVQEVITEVDSEGQPLRPHFEKLQPTILAIVKEEVARTQQPMTSDQLRKAYEQAELAHPDTREAALQRIIAKKSAAQPGPDVQKQQEDAARVAKAKQASTQIIDGPGQGASPQPAKNADIGLEAFLRQQMAGGS